MPAFKRRGCGAICPGRFPGGPSRHLHLMVTYASRQVRVSWFNAKTKWTLASSLAMPMSRARRSNSLANSLAAVPACRIVATPRRKLNSLHCSRSWTCSITYPQVVSPTICPSSPINLCHPQCATHLQPRINVRAHR